MFSALTFGSPWWLWGLLALLPLVALFVWAEAEARRRLVRLIQTPRLRGQLTGGASTSRRRVRYALLLAGLAAFLFAAAAPRWGYQTREVHRRGLDVIVIVDVSRSMLAKDLPPSRLARAKLAVQDLTTQLQGDRLGLIAFAGSAFLQAPLTLDYDAVLNASSELDTDLIPRGGTNLGGAIDLALDAFGKAEGGSRAIIFMSDGEPTDVSEQSNGMQAAARAATAGVRIFTVGFGTPEGALIPLDREGSFVRDQDGKIVHTHLAEDGLRDLAKAANGFYLRFVGEATMKAVVTQGLGQMKTGEIDARQTRQPIERYQWPLGVGILCLSLAALLGERRRTRQVSGDVTVSRRAVEKTAVTAVITLGFWLAVIISPGHAEDAKGKDLPTGNALELYRSGNYAEAYRAFEELAKKNPQMDSLQFNAGTSAYMGKKYDEALDAFNKTLTSNDPDLQAKANYNFANTLFRRGENQQDKEKKIKDWRNAIEHYKSALDTLNRRGENAGKPQTDRLTTDTAFNRDFVQKQLDELLKEPPKPKQQGGSSDKPQNKDDKSDNQQGGGGQADQNQPPKPEQSPSSSKSQGQSSPPSQSPSPQNGSGQSSDQKDQNEQPPGPGPSPSPGSGKSSPQDRKDDKSPDGSQPGQTPDPGPAPNQDKPRPHGDFQAKPGEHADGGAPKPTPGSQPASGETPDQVGEAGASPKPTPGEQPTPSDDAEEVGKMSPKQAEALLDSLKNEDRQVNLSDPDGKRHRQDESVLKDW